MLLVVEDSLSRLSCTALTALLVRSPATISMPDSLRAGAPHSRWIKSSLARHKTRGCMLVQCCSQRTPRSVKAADIALGFDGLRQSDAINNDESTLIQHADLASHRFKEPASSPDPCGRWRCRLVANHCTNHASMLAAECQRFWLCFSRLKVAEFPEAHDR